MKNLIQQFKWCSLAVMLSMTTSYVTWAQQLAPQDVHKVYKVYDMFDGKLIDPSKWSSQWQCGPGAMECVREIEAGRLHLKVRVYGATNTNVGGQFGVSELYLGAGSAATDIATAVVIRGTSAKDCPTNTETGSHGQALLFGAFFNGGGGTPADDVQAFLQLDRYAETPDVALVGGFLNYQGQFFGNVQVGEINVGERAIVQLTWDLPNHRFIIRLIRPTRQTMSEQYMPYAMPDTAPAVAPGKGLSARAFPPNCVGVKTYAEMDVLFDKVTVGQ